MCEVMVVRFAVAIILKNRRFYRTFRFIAQVFSAMWIDFYEANLFNGILVISRFDWGPPLLLPRGKLRNISGASRFKIAKRIILTNTTVRILVEKWFLPCS
jgi:hypothetical protein